MNSNAKSVCEEQVYLLLDDSVVRISENCRLVPHKPVKDLRNPIIPKTEEWEGWGPYMPVGCGISWIPERDVYRMDYLAFGYFADDPHGAGFYRTAYAESKDGLEWTKPPREQTENSLHFCYDPRPETEDKHRYANFGFKYVRGSDGDHFYNVLTFAYDRDHVSEVIEIPAFTSDIREALFDPYRNRFVVYYKLWKIRGYEKDDTAPGGCKPVAYYAIGFDIANRDGWDDVTGLFVEIDPDGGYRTGNKTVTLKSGEQGADDGGGASLSGLWNAKRVVFRAESEDFIHWSNCAEVMEADDKDRESANIQGIHVFHYGHYYMAYASIHDERGFLDSQLAFSHDGIHWSRPWRKMFIEHGVAGSFDHGYTYIPQAPLIMDTKMVIYYGGCSCGHADYEGFMGIGRAVMRRDGFACRSATGPETATLETVLLNRELDSLYVNADAEGGTLTAALLDEDGRVIPGYSHECCEPISEDTASFAACRLAFSWNGSDKLPRVDRLRVQLKFRNADVYSIML